jgi:hypothetical protein
MLLIGIIVLVVALIAGATLLVLGLCGASAAMDEMESGPELPVRESDRNLQPRGTGPEVVHRLRLASLHMKGFVSRKQTASGSPRCGDPLLVPA